MKTTLRTAESVCEGHPDKICDQISDAVLDACLEQDPQSRVACETMVNSAGTCIVAGEITSKARIDIEGIVYEIWPDAKRVLIDLQQQSPALAETVQNGGANDQGIVVGYACDETPEYMPLPITLAHAVARRLTQVRKDGTMPYLRPDGKAQVTVQGNTVHTVVVSAQHDEHVSLETLREDILEHVLCVLPLTLQSVVLVNRQVGRFEVSADTGVTGRKIVMDAYGPQVPDGGGAFSGKDPSKLDRSGAYMLRHIAKNVVASGLAKHVLIEAAYCIGVAEPVALRIDSDGDARELREYVQGFPLTPGGIIDYLQLRKPIYRATAVGGHFGRGGVPWEYLVFQERRQYEFCHR
jgi:S-adenosylmethionine synthetase